MIEQALKRLRTNPDNCKHELAKSCRGSIEWLEAETAKLQDSRQPGDKAKAAEYLAKAEHIRKNPDNWIKSKVLLPSPAAEAANLTRRKEELEAQLPFLD